MADNQLKQYVIRPLLEKMGQAALESNFSRPPVFIVGCGRSGTTLLLSILSAHPHIFALPHESTAFANWHIPEGESGKKPFPKRLDRFYRHLLFSNIPEQAHRFCEKTPNNVRVLEHILDFFNGDARIIHLIRDGRDVMLSRHPDKPGSYWITPERWVSDVRHGLAYQAHPHVHTLFYEDLVTAYPQTISKLCQFLDEPCTEAVLNWFTHTSVRQDRAWEGSLKQLHTNALRKWHKNNEQQRVQEVMEHEGVMALLRELGYEASDNPY